MDRSTAPNIRLPLVPQSARTPAIRRPHLRTRLARDGLRGIVGCFWRKSGLGPGSSKKALHQSAAESVLAKAKEHHHMCERSDPDQTLGKGTGVGSGALYHIDFALSTQADRRGGGGMACTGGSSSSCGGLGREGGDRSPALVNAGVGVAGASDETRGLTMACVGQGRFECGATLFVPHPKPGYD